MQTIVIKMKLIATNLIAAIKKRKCEICNDRLGILHCDDGSWICETCAQHMSDLGSELN